MKSFTAVIALFSAAACVSAAPTAFPTASNDIYRPTGVFQPGTLPGLYTHHVALDGTVHTEYHGEMNTTVPVSGTKPAKRGSTGVHCSNLSFSASDASAAAQGLANSFNSQPQFYHAISYSSGSATAYGCDYGNGQRMSSVEYMGYFNDVSFDCGSTKEGWYSLPDAKASYGVTTAGNGFC
ncbi:hypothetical protein PHLGIDRAFT_129398 [Phlebiopsis gigantea 11061_1 CR5-6]|uniref:AA1-like domain-containing protein n=1 Tax=Phlebiopsis gigantea (strain 11061_1 CR5-6) TaxID=745531 RepID=A0A0C3PFY1_PHLG1|nr:hypothetical protein PHLGIDRAFT_129398 [Phlebiopsis gigantea 11061_1 CR5-6]